MEQQINNLQLEVLRRRKQRQLIKMIELDDNSPQPSDFVTIQGGEGKQTAYNKGQAILRQSSDEQSLTSPVDTKEKNPLELQDTEHAELKVGVQKNGKKYSVRTNRKRFFFPREFNDFWDALDNVNQKRCFDILINTGARYNEAKHIKREDIDFQRGTLTIKVAKIKAKKGQRFPDPRTFKVSSQFLERLKEYTENLKDSDTIPFLTNSCLNIALKKVLGKIGIKDNFMFSVHNLRKTHGNWLVAHDVNIANICKRLGHDYNTFLGSYASADIFNDEDRKLIKEILGDIIK